MDNLIMPFSHRLWRIVWRLCLSFALAGPCWAGEPAKKAAGPEVEDLGGGRYRVGSIEIDKAKQRFSLPGVVIRLEPANTPVEFIAVTRGGMKNYESILEMDTSAIEFNLACIMIGLDPGQAAALPEQHFDPRPVQGDRVELSVSWQRDGKSRRVRVEDMLQVNGQKPPGPHEWVYTGSRFSPDGDYMAEVSGALIGFVHDTDSIIQHRKGLGMGDYGAIRANTLVLPPALTPVTLQVSRRPD
ncbi:MAG: hypothetical protein BMS9Abin08_0539 [Gammaproteobacteria bacterium]|nr:MAG: hypothetical protein BMS9Abin08_0539 [Gammaproteobacteria bacterium]